MIDDSDPLLEEAKNELAVLIEANPGLRLFLEHVQAGRDDARAEADQLSTTLRELLESCEAFILTAIAVRMGIPTDDQKIAVEARFNAAKRSARALLAEESA